MVRVEGNIAVQVADEFVSDILQSLPAGIKGVHFSGEMALAPLGKIHQFDPRIFLEVTADYACRSVG